MNEQTPPTLAAYLANAAAQINRGNGQQQRQIYPGELETAKAQVEAQMEYIAPPVGKECAERLRKSAAATAEAIMAQAAERVSVAESVLEEAKALEEKARAIANDVIAQGEEAAKNAIKIATHQNELIDVLTATTQKHASQ